MIVYDTKKWLGTLKILIRGFRHSQNYKRLLGFTTVAGLYSALLILLEHWGLYSVVRLNTVVFSLIGVILSLILVFRLNTSYNKWWEGRQQWGKLVNTCRSLAQHLHPFLGDDQTWRKRIAAGIGNFPFALKNHLRSKPLDEDYHGLTGDEFAALTKDPHLPNYLGRQMQMDLVKLKDEGRIDGFDKQSCNRLVHDLIDVLGACERIKNTPIPFSHSSFIQVALVLYLLVLPLGLIDSFGWMTIFMQCVMTFTLVGVEIISEEIEEPFGTDPNDLPLARLSNVIRKDVYHILEVPASADAFTKFEIERNKVKVQI